MRQYHEPYDLHRNEARNAMSDLNEIDEWTGDIHQGDVFDVLDSIPNSSVHMGMTSPPYFGLRDYGEDGQIGLEETLDDYVQKMVRVGDHVRDVLRPDGSWWLNLGDSYSQSGRSNHDKNGTVPDGEGHSRGHDPGDFGEKNKMLVPHRVAIALQDAGWVVRNDAVWRKTNPMPESAEDRLSTTFEFVFHLTPNPHYYYDLDAIREPCDITQTASGSNAPEGKNPGDIFEVPTGSFPKGHFAVYDEELCEKPIKATCPDEVCAACGTPTPHAGVGNTMLSSFCGCETDDTKPGIVLDMFAGSGTTCAAARERGRRFIGVELNPEYVAYAQEKVGVPVDNPHHLTDDHTASLQEFTEGSPD